MYGKTLSYISSTLQFLFQMAQVLPFINVLLVHIDSDEISICPIKTTSSQNVTNTV